ncbi:hypothetical protein CEXT_285131 [Caerostris extrusa]|uniref:Secreted protein n=1 Tax=Caerostris extrusa TaxID=172846 RepID=A0AAV4V9C1_CAEEX|nr:hypothetical protein CEXT_285131 [Caerostris extrusa]
MAHRLCTYQCAGLPIAIAVMDMSCATFLFHGQYRAAQLGEPMSSHGVDRDSGFSSPIGSHMTMSSGAHNRYTCWFSLVVQPALAARLLLHTLRENNKDLSTSDKLP